MKTQSGQNAIHSNSRLTGLRKFLAIGAASVAGFSVTALTPSAASAALKPRPFNPGAPVCRTVAPFKVNTTVVANEAPVLISFQLIAPGSVPTANGNVAYGFSSNSVYELKSSYVGEINFPVSAYNLFGISSSEIQTLELRMNVSRPSGPEGIVTRLDVDLRSPVVQRTIRLGGSSSSMAQVTLAAEQVGAARTMC